MKEASDGGYIIAGSYYSTADPPPTSLLVVKTDSSGDTLWTKKYFGPGYITPYSMDKTNDGGFIICGEITVSNPYANTDLLLLKIDTLGNELWRKYYGGEHNERGLSIRETYDDSYILVGSKNDDLWVDDLWVLKTNADGDTLWTRTYGSDSMDIGTSVDLTSDGDYIIAGTTGSFGLGSQDMWLLKLNSSGDTVWTRTYGGYYSDEAYSVRAAKDGGFIMCGYTCSSDIGTALFVKTDSLGHAPLPLPSLTPPIIDTTLKVYIGYPIVIYYEKYLQGFHADVYDHAGRKVGKINQNETKGSITWGENEPSGIYFLKEEQGRRFKLILLH